MNKKKLIQAVPKPGSLVQCIRRNPCFYKPTGLHEASMAAFLAMKPGEYKTIEIRGSEVVVVFCEAYWRESEYSYILTCKLLHPEHGVLFDSYGKSKNDYSCFPILGEHFYPIHDHTWPPT